VGLFYELEFGDWEILKPACRQAGWETGKSLLVRSLPIFLNIHANRKK
jgi:hypothetical protein